MGLNETLDHPEPQTDAMRFGSLFHDLMACSETQAYRMLGNGWTV